MTTFQLLRDRDEYKRDEYKRDEYKRDENNRNEYKRDEYKRDQNNRDEYKRDKYTCMQASDGRKCHLVDSQCRTRGKQSSACLGSGLLRAPVSDERIELVLGRHETWVSSVQQDGC